MRHVRSFLAAAFILVGLLAAGAVPALVAKPAHAAPTNPADGTNAAVQYANKTWNWCDYQGTYDSNVGCQYVQAGQYQSDFQCAEYVSRALAAEGVMPGLNAYTTPSWGANTFGSYVYGGISYDLNWVGAPNGGTYLNGIYDYLINSGRGVDIGDNPAQATPGDLVFYYDGYGNRYHVTILTVTGGTPGGSDTMVDSHNVAALDSGYAWSSVRHIVHLHINNADDVYIRGANGDLIDYHWSRTTGTNGEWITSDLNGAVSPWLTVSFVGKPSGGTSTLDGTQMQDVSAVGSDGNLYKFYLQGGVWHVTPLYPPAGVRFVGSPTGLAYELPGQTSDNYAIFVVGSNGHLYDYAWSEGHAWVLTDLTGTLGPTSCRQICLQFAITGTPSAHAFVQMQSGNPTLLLDVFDVGNDGCVYQYWWDGTWHENGLASYAVPTDGATFVGSPSAFSYVQAGSSAVYHAVYVEGSDNHIYEYNWCTWCSWSLYDMTNAAGGVSSASFIGSPNASYIMMGSALTIDVFVTASDHHLYSYWWQQGVWHFQDLSAAANATTTQVVSSPSGFSYYLSGNGSDRCSIWVLAGSGHLVQFYYIQGSSWGTYDQGAPPIPLTGDPDAHGYASF